MYAHTQNIWTISQQMNDENKHDDKNRSSFDAFIEYILIWFVFSEHLHFCLFSSNYIHQERIWGSHAKIEVFLATKKHVSTNRLLDLDNWKGSSP